MFSPPLAGRVVATCGALPDTLHMFIWLTHKAERQDTQIKQRLAWLLLGWMTAERSYPCKQPACPAVGGGSIPYLYNATLSKITNKGCSFPLIPHNGFRDPIVITPPVPHKYPIPTCFTAVACPPSSRRYMAVLPPVSTQHNLSHFPSSVAIYYDHANTVVVRFYLHLFAVQTPTLAE
ncbi:hypothetical protein J6590_011989 [Homalodisca vitripennis]|nr:hypothetical protein J6590_011989 [Homalodisca vitripennis]